MKDINLGTIIVSKTYNFVKFSGGLYGAVNPDTGIVEYGGRTLKDLKSALDEGSEVLSEISLGSPVRVALELEKARVLSETE